MDCKLEASLNCVERPCPKPKPKPKVKEPGTSLLWKGVRAPTVGRKVSFVFPSGEKLHHLCWGQTGKATQGHVNVSHGPGHSHSRDRLYLAGWVALFMKFRELVYGSSSGGCCRA